MHSVPQPIPMKVILVLASWSSGSTAVAGFLDKCGCYSCPPHQTTDDIKTPVAYESKQYRDALVNCIDECTLKIKGSAEDFESFFKEWIAQQYVKARENGCSSIILKHPLQSFLLQKITKHISPICVVVTRPLAKIEQTRLRRKWHPVYGAAGAKAVYNATYIYLHENGYCYMAIPYEKFREDDFVRKQLLSFCGINPTIEQMHSAISFIK